MDTFHISALSLTKSNNESLKSFSQRIQNILGTLPKNTDLVVLPEYCWGTTTIEEIKTQLIEIKNNCSFNIIFGSHAFELKKGRMTNNAIISTFGNELIYSSKTLPMQGERERNRVIEGKNWGIIKINDVKVGILICADLWNWRLIYDLIHRQGAQILVVPAFTVVPPKFRDYAKYQWLSLGITRSREFVVPIIIADHHVNTLEYDVGAVTCIIDPSKKDKSIHNVDDFVFLPTGNMVSTSINFNNIRKYRTYRNANGLLQ